MAVAICTGIALAELIFQFWEYDKLLPTAEILESPVLVCRMAIYRLYWPKGLTEEWKEEYWKYIKKHPDAAAKGLTERGEREILSWLTEAKGDMTVRC